MQRHIKMHSFQRHASANIYYLEDQGWLAIIYSFEFVKVHVVLVMTILIENY